MVLYVPEILFLMFRSYDSSYRVAYIRKSFPLFIYYIFINLNLDGEPFFSTNIAGVGLCFHQKYDVPLSWLRGVFSCFWCFFFFFFFLSFCFNVPLLELHAAAYNSLLLSCSFQIYQRFVDGFLYGGLLKFFGTIICGQIICIYSVVLFPLPVMEFWIYVIERGDLWSITCGWALFLLVMKDGWRALPPLSLALAEVKSTQKKKKGSVGAGQSAIVE